MRWLIQPFPGSLPSLFPRRKRASSSCGLSVRYGTCPRPPPHPPAPHDIHVPMQHLPPLPLPVSPVTQRKNLFRHGSPSPDTGTRGCCVYTQDVAVRIDGFIPHRRKTMAHTRQQEGRLQLSRNCGKCTVAVRRPALAPPTF